MGDVGFGDRRSWENRLRLLVPPVKKKKRKKSVYSATCPPLLTGAFIQFKPALKHKARGKQKCEVFRYLFGLVGVRVVHREGQIVLQVF